METPSIPNSESPPPKANSQRRSGSHSRSWVAGCAALAAIAACLFNGGSASALSLITLFTGAGLLMAPPRYRLPRPLLFCALLALVAAASSLLPTFWFGSLPEWRSRLVEDWGFQIPSTRSVQPALSLGGLLTLITGCAWFFLVLGRGLQESGRRLTLQLLTLGIYLIATLSLLQKLDWIDLGWPLGAAHSGLDLGPFPNRNHFSGLCAIGCVLGAGLAHDAYRKNNTALLLSFGIGLVLPFAGIVINTSRAGLLLFFIGLTLWLTTAALRQGFFRKLALTTSLLLSATAILLVFGGGAGAKLVEQGIGSQGLGARSTIYGETFRLIFQNPWLGFGLGNFDALFSLHHQMPNSSARYVHPESDWLWWWSEVGLLGLLPLLFALVWILRLGLSSPTSPKHRPHRQDRRLRSTAAIGLLLAAIHGLFDVPLHGIGFAAIILLLAACAIPQRRLKTPPHWLSSLGFRLTGLALLALGTAQLLSARGTPVLHDQTSLDARRPILYALTAADRHQEALQAVELALTQQAPLDWSLHFQRGLLRLKLRQPAGAALEDFNRARVLEPHNTNLRLEEGLLWLRHQPSLAIIPWRDLLQKTNPTGHYAHLLALAQPHPELREGLRLLAQSPPLKALYAIHSLNASEWTQTLQELLVMDPDLTQIDAELRRQLFQTWQARGDRAEWVTALESNAQWQAEAWSLLAEEYAQRSEFEKAWNLQKKYVFSTLPAAAHTETHLDQLERHFLFNPTDTSRGVELYFAQRRLGKLTDARRTLDRLLTLPDAPDYLLQELASLHADQRDFRLAYETMKQSLVKKAP